MNKKHLTLAIGSAMTSGLLATPPSIQAGENPFAMTEIRPAEQLATAEGNTEQAGANGKVDEGKCGEGKCGAGKKVDKQASEGACGAKMPVDKMPEAACGAKKPQ